MNAEEACHAICNSLNDSDSEECLDRDSSEEDDELEEQLCADDEDASLSAYSESADYDRSSSLVFSKDKKHSYSTVPGNASIRTPAANIFTKMPGFTKRALNNGFSALDAFNMFVSKEIKEQILRSTNAFISSSENAVKSLEMHEIDNFLGVILLIGLLKGKNSYRREFWSKEYGIEAIKSSMKMTRFELMCAKLRFDQRAMRNERDPLAPIRLIFETFIENCRRNYIPSEQMTIDEQLVTFRGRCKFRMYIPSKPGCYGINIWALCDAKSAYFYNAEIYSGKKLHSPEKNQGENVVKSLSIPIYNSGRNITTDNFFTTMSLARFLLDQRLTIVGTVRKNKTFLPVEFQSSKGNEGDVTFLFQDKLTLVKYNGKKNKSVVLLSTQHHYPEINETTKKPEIIHYYNATKGGVDTIDQIVRFHSCKRATRRWPMALFYNIIDIAAYNAFLLYIEKNPEFSLKHKKQSRRQFLKILTNSLLTAIPNDGTPAKRDKPERGSCAICQGGKRPRSRVACDICLRFVCDSHRKSAIICRDCTLNEN